MSDHVVPVRIYVGIFFALIVLTVATALIAYVDLGVFNNVVAIGIAIVKASLVALFFMHLRYSARMNPLVFGAGLFWLCIFIALTLADILTRGWLGIPGK